MDFKCFEIQRYQRVGRTRERTPFLKKRAKNFYVGAGGCIPAMAG
jgi:hypothetical protein